MLTASGGGKLRLDVAGERFDLFEQDDQHGDVAAGDRGVGGAVGAEQATWCSGQAGVQYGGVDPAGVGLARQPVAQPDRAEPVRLVLGRDRVTNVRLIGLSMSANRPTAPGKALRR